MVRRYAEFNKKEETMCKCSCEKSYEFNNETIQISPHPMDSSCLRLVVKCPESVHRRGDLILATLDRARGLKLRELDDNHREWLEYEFGFEFNPLTNEIAVE